MLTVTVMISLSFALRSTRLPVGDVMVKNSVTLEIAVYLDIYGETLSGV